MLSYATAIHVLLTVYILSQSGMSVVKFSVSIGAPHPMYVLLACYTDLKNWAPVIAKLPQCRWKSCITIQSMLHGDARDSVSRSVVKGWNNFAFNRKKECKFANLMLYKLKMNALLLYIIDILIAVGSKITSVEIMAVFPYPDWTFATPLWSGRYRVWLERDRNNTK